jgi:hypothetical protein
MTIRGPRLDKDVRYALAVATAAARKNGTLVRHRINGLVDARRTVATIRDESTGEARFLSVEACDAIDRLIVCLGGEVPR